MIATQRINLQKYTRLPLTVIEFANQTLPSIIVSTPHKGSVSIDVKQLHVPFLFGSVTQTDKSAQDILNQIYELEREATDFLYKEWLNKTNDK